MYRWVFVRFTHTLISLLVSVHLMESFTGNIYPLEGRAFIRILNPGDSTATCDRELKQAEFACAFSFSLPPLFEKLKTAFSSSCTLLSWLWLQTYTPSWESCYNKAHYCYWKKNQSPGVTHKNSHGSSCKHYKRPNRSEKSPVYLFFFFDLRCVEEKELKNNERKKALKMISCSPAVRGLREEKWRRWEWKWKVYVFVHSLKD